MLSRSSRRLSCSWPWLRSSLRDDGADRGFERERISVAQLAAQDVVLLGDHPRDAIGRIGGDPGEIVRQAAPAERAIGRVGLEGQLQRRRRSRSVARSTVRTVPALPVEMNCDTSSFLPSAVTASARGVVPSASTRAERRVLRRELLYLPGTLQREVAGRAVRREHHADGSRAPGQVQHLHRGAGGGIQHPHGVVVPAGDPQLVRRIDARRSSAACRPRFRSAPRACPRSAP